VLNSYNPITVKVSIVVHKNEVFTENEQRLGVDYMLQEIYQAEKTTLNVVLYAYLIYL